MFYLSRSITPFSDSKKNLASVTLNIITIGLIHPLCKQFPITAFSLLYLPTPILSMHMHASLPAWVLIISHTVPLHIVMPSLLCADLNTLCQITMIPFHSQNCTDANFTWPHLMPLKLVFFSERIADGLLPLRISSSSSPRMLSHEDSAAGLGLLLKSKNFYSALNLVL